MRDQPRYLLAIALAACLAVAALHLSDGSALATDDTAAPNADRGQALADRLCSGCHLTGTSSTKVLPVGPPTFAGIANKNGQSGIAIEYVLINSHPPMPDMHLTRDEIASLILYIDTFRTDEKAPPLLKQPGEPKPKYPAPS